MNFMVIRSKFKILLADKEFKEGRRITYDEICEETGISPSTLSRFANNETKRFYSNTLGNLCKYFNCQVGDLLEYIPS